MGQLQDAFSDAAGEVASIKAQPSNRYWWLYGTIKAKNANGTIDVAIDGVTIQQVKATVSCMTANVGDRVIVLKAGPLMTCVDVIATSDKVKVPASSITGTLPVANGGTGATTAAEALTALGAASVASLKTLGESVSRTDTLYGGSSIVSGSDLNDFKYAGCWKVSNNKIASSMKNCPVKQAFCLRVRQPLDDDGFSPDVVYAVQELLTYRNLRYARYYDGYVDEWGTWKSY